MNHGYSDDPPFTLQIAQTNVELIFLRDVSRLSEIFEG